MGEENIAELETLIRSETNGCRIVLDLKDLTLAGQDAISFLERCEAEGITLKNCAAYVREWITRQRETTVSGLVPERRKYSRRTKGVKNGGTSNLGK
jgi:hypothetical protein